ncbi:hypothetical protein DL769_000369 [Monosporascus sp. CRB-8-3]|nr:hypothetical protein DL769_000369 [Monosporascus sp. CRB-8-3]
MTTVSSTSPVIYNGPKDWDRFKGEFQARACALDIWDYIDPDQSLPWPVRPTEPDITSYPKRRLRPQTCTNTPSSEGTLSLEEVDHTSQPASTLEMTTEGRQAYNQDFTAYTYKDRKYDTFRKSNNDLTKWVLESMSPAVKETSLLPGKNLREWYAKLAESGKVYDSRLLINTQREYRERLKQASKSARKLDEWIVRWQDIMAQGQRHGVPETKTTIVWVNDLCTALAPIVGTWTTTFQMVKKSEIDNGTISYQEVAANLLDHWTMTHPQPISKNVKAAFPTFHGTPADPLDQDDPDQEETKDINPQPRGKTPGRSTIHIFNLISRFLNYRTTIQGDGVYAGNSFVPIRGYGDVDVLLQSPDGPRALRLYDVAHCEDFACNLVSLRQLQKKGYWWDNRGINNFIRDKYDQVVATLTDKFDQFVIEDISATATHAALATYRRNVNSWTARPPRTGDGTMWHLRLGHPGPEVIARLRSHTKGVRLKGPTTVECQACGKAKAKRQIRREPREGASRSGQRIAIDFTDFEEDPEKTRKDTDTLSFEHLLGVLKNQDKVFPQVIECDNEILKNYQLRDMLQSPPFSIRLEPSAPHTQAQNGGAERSGEPASFLIVYIFKAAVYLYNRTPKYALFWQSPYEVYYTYLAYRDGVAVLDRKPQQAHLRTYGCMAYAMTITAIKKEQRLQKLNPKAWIGFLVGYRSTNIYEIWNPLINKVVATRDVQFNEKATFSGDIKDLKDDLIHVTEDELQNLLQRVEVPDQAHGHLGEMFREAERAYLQSHKEMRSWEVVDQSSAKGKQVLGCTWVYVYKFNKHGWLQKCKARLVVRGDQQLKAACGNTYASTLAGRSFRALIATAARFDLELKQYDAINAFVNANLPYEVYMKTPPGYPQRGKTLLIRKALYGLRESPLLWQKDFTGTLKRLGLSPVPHEPCCFTRQGVLIFFFVDDIVTAYRKEDQDLVDQLIQQIRERYTLTEGEDLQWFLGIELIGDRAERKIWLSQSDFIDKLANLVPKESLNDLPDTPMTNVELLPNPDLAHPGSVNRYQKKIGSILYVAVNTRPDISFAVSRLARFNLNPSNAHHKAADRVILYLIGTKTLALQFGGEDSLDTWSDASFADNMIDRKSSQAYVMKLFGGVIGWRANKQDTVTTSTTEAELLSLTQAAKEALFSSRLIKELGVTLDAGPLNMWCDNQQTIRLINADVALLQTKLRHVDIHNHWLREAAERDLIRVDYTPTGDMLADGLTKALSREPFRHFREQLGLVDITEALERRRNTLRVISEEELADQEDSIAGGEVEWKAVAPGSDEVWRSTP